MAVFVVAFIGLGLLATPGSSTGYTVEKGKLYFVGVGPAGPQFATLQALDVIRKADVVFAPNFIRQAFNEQLKDKDVRLAWPDSVYKIGDRPYTAAKSKKEGKKVLEEIHKNAEQLGEEFRREMSQGKSVACLVNGDPCLFSDLRWFKKYFKDSEYEVIPGLSSFNVGSALFKLDLTQPMGLNTVILNHPVKRSQVKDLAEHEATMVFFMAGDLETLVDDLEKEYSDDTPVAILDFIGYPDRQRLTKGTLQTILKDMTSVPDTDLRLVYVGEFMK
jgi:precorrin-4 methylase